MAAGKKGGLGRGLDALFADSVPIVEEKQIKRETKKDSQDETQTESHETVGKGESVQYIKIHDIMPNSNQPRKVFDEGKIEELAKSIVQNGIIQPLVVRKRKSGYEIVAGERRWRASIKANLQEVPCLVRELSDKQNMLIAVIENMQREDLNPIEEAEGLNQMMSTYGLTQEEVSDSVGKSRPYIANSIRLLKLPDSIKEQVSEGKISAAHGRTILALKDVKDQESLCKQIIEQGLSVRQVEKLVGDKGKKTRPVAAKRRKNPDVELVEEELKEILGTKVSIEQNGKKGKIEIEFFNKDELNRLIELLKSLG